MKKNNKRQVYIEITQSIGIAKNKNVFIIHYILNSLVIYIYTYLDREQNTKLIKERHVYTFSVC